MRKLGSHLRRAKVARAYSLGLLRPLGRVVQGSDISATRSLPVGSVDVGQAARVHPVFAWKDLAGFLHLVCATPTGPVAVSLLMANMKVLLKEDPFTPYQLSPDPFALVGDIKLMHRRGLVPDSWGIDPADSAE